MQMRSVLLAALGAAVLAATASAASADPYFYRPRHERVIVVRREAPCWRCEHRWHYRYDRFGRRY